MNFSDADLEALADPAALRAIMQASAALISSTDAHAAAVQVKRNTKEIADARNQAALRVEIANDKGTPISYEWTGEGYYAPFDDDLGWMKFTRDADETYWARRLFRLRGGTGRLPGCTQLICLPSMIA